MPISSLQGLDHNSRVIYIGTFSKTLFPALRLGYMVIPPDLVARFAALRRVLDIFPSYFHQEVMTEFIQKGHFARHIRRTRALYAEGAMPLSMRSEVSSDRVPDCRRRTGIRLSYVCHTVMRRGDRGAGGETQALAMAAFPIVCWKGRPTRLRSWICRNQSRRNSRSSQAIEKRAEGLSFTHVQRTDVPP